MWRTGGEHLLTSPRMRGLCYESLAANTDPVASSRTSPTAAADQRVTVFEADARDSARSDRTQRRLLVAEFELRDAIGPPTLVRRWRSLSVTIVSPDGIYSSVSTRASWRSVRLVPGNVVAVEPFVDYVDVDDLDTESSSRLTGLPGQPGGGHQHGPVSAVQWP